MTWYAAHAILYVKLKSGHQDTFPVWENIYLIAGDTPTEALEEARKCGLAASGDSDGSFTWGDQPAEWVFAGIRKLITVSHKGIVEQPMSGDEVSYSEFELPTLDAVMNLANGKDVILEYLE